MKDNPLDRDFYFHLDTGISPRDFFAAHALMVLDIQAHVSRPSASNIAESAYNIADAMLAEREKK